MPASCRNTGPGILAIVLAATLLPASARAQAGLTGNGLSGQAEELRGNTPFIQGFQSKSALGQLEELTGATVDRSSPQSNPPAPVAQPATPRFDPNQAFRTQLAGAVVGMLLDSIFSDDSAQQQAAAEAAAAQAAAQVAAEAEAFRVQQEQARKARILLAQHYRAEWDSRESEISDQLGGAFDVGPATSFFGEPANPNAETAALLSQVGGGASPDQGAAPDNSDWDTSVVDLRGSSGVVSLLRSGVTNPRARTSASGSRMPHWAYDWPETEVPPPSRPPSQLQGLLAYFGPWLRDWYKDVAKDTAKETLWGLAEHIPGQDRVKALYDFNSERIEMTEKMKKTYDPLFDLALGGATNAANSLGNPYSSGSELADSQFDSLEQRGGKVVVDAWAMAFKQFTGHFGGIDLGKLQPVSGDGNMVALNDVPEHVDYSRVRDVLFGPIKNSSSMVTPRSINGLPESYGPPPESY